MALVIKAICLKKKGGVKHMGRKKEDNSMTKLIIKKSKEKNRQKSVLEVDDIANHYLELAEDKELLGELMLAARVIAKKLNMTQDGYRLILNQGENGGQAVEHIHLHLLGGKRLGPKIVN